MKLSDLPEEFKIYTLVMSNGKEYEVTGTQFGIIIGAKDNLIRLPNGEGFNKSFLVSWHINIEKTRELVQENKAKLEDGTYQMSKRE